MNKRIPRRTHPLIGWFKDTKAFVQLGPHDFFLSTYEQLGSPEVFAYQSLGARKVAVTDWEAIQAIANGKGVEKSGYIIELVKKKLGNSLLVMQSYQDWEQRNQIVKNVYNPGGHKAALERSQQLAKLLANARCKHWEGKIDPIVEAKDFTLDFIMEFMAGYPPTTQHKNKAIALVDGLLDYFMVAFPLGEAIADILRGRQLDEAIKGVAEVVNEMVAFARANPGHVSMISVLLDAVGKDGFTMLDLYAECFLIFTAGYETTASIIPSAFVFLANHPDIQQALREEAQTATNITVKESPLLEAFFKEILRLYPPVSSIERTVTKQIQVGPYSLSRGQVVTLPIDLMMHLAKYFPNPERLDLSRYQPDSDDTNDLTNLVFGGTGRLCKGKELARVEFKTMMRTALLMWCWEPVNPGEPNRISKNAQSIDPTDPRRILVFSSL